jgi:ABC-2 type transport system ATP-binding protein
VLVSSHLMSELEDTADHLVVVGRGTVIADTSVRDLQVVALLGRRSVFRGRPPGGDELGPGVGPNRPRGRR